MDAQVFWKVIGNYNNATWTAQCILFALIVAGVMLAYFGKAIWLPKIALGAANLFIGTVFFLVYGSEPIQTYFAAPLFISAGLLFLWEAANFSGSAFNRFSRAQWILLCLVMLYPLVVIGAFFSTDRHVCNAVPDNQPQHCDIYVLRTSEQSIARSYVNMGAYRDKIFLI